MSAPHKQYHLSQETQQRRQETTAATLQSLNTQNIDLRCKRQSISKARVNDLIISLPPQLEGYYSYYKHLKRAAAVVSLKQKYEWKGNDC